jgi:cellulose synthase/poly-beta-1,6-N-acetylglucosamine synthase-like glycosyltransferase
LKNPIDKMPMQDSDKINLDKPEALPHISVCICTYKRPELLKALLASLKDQTSDGLFSFSVVVVDNDRNGSARNTVAEFAESADIVTKYQIEPRQNIALARNTAVEHADGEYIAFIDDDEFLTTRDWLKMLYSAVQNYNADGALGPVKPHYPPGTPDWVVQGKFYDRPSYKTGTVINWRKGRTGNTLLKRECLSSCDGPFRPEFRTGEDQDLFRRLIEKGNTFVWCHEAMAYESIPATRWNRTFMLKRALLRGATSLRHPSFGGREVLSSTVAVPAYLVALPFAFVFGQGRFMQILVRLFDHLGRLLALAGINPIQEPYVTE